MLSSWPKPPKPWRPQRRSTDPEGSRPYIGALLLGYYTEDDLLLYAAGRTGVRPELVVEVTYLTWTEDNLLRHVSYLGQREDKPAREVVRLIPHPFRRNEL